MLFSVKSGDFHSRRDGSDINPSPKSFLRQDNHSICSCTPDALQIVSDTVRSATLIPLPSSFSISAQFAFVRFSSISTAMQQCYSPDPFFDNPLPITPWSLHRAMPHFFFAGQYLADSTLSTVQNPRDPTRHLPRGRQCVRPNLHSAEISLPENKRNETYRRAKRLFRRGEIQAGETRIAVYPVDFACALLISSARLSSSSRQYAAVPIDPSS
jgi:hypothetical protein